MDFELAVDKYSINEFRFSPVGLIPYTKMDSFDIAPFEIYSSENIENKFKKQIEESSVLKPIKSTVYRGLDNKKIIIGYVNPSKFQFLYTKIKHSFGIKKEWALGFYDHLDDSIYIVLDDNIGILGNSRYDISSVVAHEICHMAARHSKTTGFIRPAISEYYLPFYSNFISNIVSEDGLKLYTKDKVNDILKNNVNTLTELFHDMTEKFDVNKELHYNHMKVKSAKVVWGSFFRKLFDDLSLDSIMNLTEHVTGVYDKNFLGNPVRLNINMIGNSIIKSYEKIGFKNVTTLPGQEVIYPSEIVCITNQNGLHSNIVSSINKLKMTR